MSENKSDCVHYTQCESHFCNPVSGLCEQPDLGDMCSDNLKFSPEHYCKRGTCSGYPFYVCKQKKNSVPFYQMSEDTKLKLCGNDFCQYTHYCAKESTSCLPKKGFGEKCDEKLAECDHELVCFRGECTELCRTSFFEPNGGTLKDIFRKNYYGTCHISKKKFSNVRCAPLRNQPHIGVCLQKEAIVAHLIFQSPLAVVEDKGGKDAHLYFHKVGHDNIKLHQAYEASVILPKIEGNAERPAPGHTFFSMMIPIVLITVAVVLLGLLILQLRRNQRLKDEAALVSVSHESEYKRNFVDTGERAFLTDTPPSYLEATEPAPPEYDG